MYFERDKNMNKWNIIIRRMLWLLSILINGMYAQNNGLKLSINLTKEYFIEGESVYLIVTFENNNSKEIAYDRFYLEGQKLSLKVLQENGNKIDYDGARESYLTSPKQELLNAHERVSIGIIIQYYYPTFRDAFLVYRKFIPGKYTVQASFLIGNIYIKSNELTFYINPAVGKDKEALTDLEKIYIPKNYFSQDTTRTIKIYDDFINRYNGSVYAPFILNEIVWTYQKVKDNAKANEALKKLIRKYPDSGFALNAITSKYLTANEKRELLQDAILNRSSSILAKYAKDLKGIKEIFVETK